MKITKFVFVAAVPLFVTLANAQTLLIETSRPVPIAQDLPLISTENRATITDSWALICASPAENIPRKCKMEYVPAKAETQQVSISIEFLRISKKQPKVAIGIITTPLNLLLPAGMVITPDRMSKFKLAIRSCHADVSSSSGRLTTSCLVPFRLTPNIIRAFKQGNQFIVEAKILDGKTLAETKSLLGFTNIFNQLKKQN